ncbi:hypothetical protein INT45_006846 [Circinella minor]|uniref:Uncharacterized protein n=1 Tax=Circinella minor TaxID=1195481 RepID=A0A8H7VAX5_9FUNG|nr:hypothetical protein INT45_006846 [Circinella minor]
MAPVVNKATRDIIDSEKNDVVSVSSSEVSLTENDVSSESIELSPGSKYKITYPDDVLSVLKMKKEEQTTITLFQNSLTFHVSRSVWSMDYTDRLHSIYTKPTISAEPWYDPTAGYATERRYMNTATCSILGNYRVVLGQN